MKITIFMLAASVACLSIFVPFFNIGSGNLYAYPPAVGILTNAKNCLSCHADNGPWTNPDDIIIDIIQKETKKSLRGKDGSFLLAMKRYESLTVLTVIGYRKNSAEVKPYRNGWIYIDTATIKTSSISKFAPGWDVNLQASCRLVGDNLEVYENFDITVLPMTIRPSDAARDGNLLLQGMLTLGESVKGKGKEGMVGNYFERTVELKVLD